MHRWNVRFQERLIDSGGFVNQTERNINAPTAKDAQTIAEIECSSWVTQIHDLKTKWVVFKIRWIPPRD